MGCVYCARNKMNGKMYIGQTVGSLRRRRRAHELLAQNNPTLPFHRAIKKYGSAAFEWTLIFTSSNPQKLFKAEVETILDERTLYPFGYNLTRGGEGAPGAVRSPEFRQRVRAALKGRPRPLEVRQKISQTHVGIKHTDATKKKISQKTSNSMTPKRREQIRQQVAALWADPEYRKKQLKTRRSPEGRAKKSEALKKHYAEKHAVAV